MKIDLYNNHETFVAESKQDSAINRWYKDLNLTALDIERHPQFADLAILVNIHQSFWHLMTLPERNTWTSSWANVYRYKRPIRPKTLEKLKNIVSLMAERDQRRHEQRQRIKALRTEPLKRDQDNKANGSHSPSLHKQTGINESARECPYF